MSRPILLFFFWLVALKLKSRYDWRSVSTSWCWAHCGTCDQRLIMSESCCLVSVGWPLWREVGHVSCQSLSAVIVPCQVFCCLLFLFYMSPRFISTVSIQLPQTEEVKYLGLCLDRRLTCHKHIFTKRKQLGITLTKMYGLLGRKSKLSINNKLLIYVQNYAQTNLDLRNTTLGNRIHVQHRNTRTLPAEGSAYDNGRTMVCTEYGNTEGSPNLNG
jgi:hypothetical protein